MAFTVATEEGSADANAYVAVAEADTYLTDRGYDDAWSALEEAAKQRFIIQATDYMDRRWGRLLTSSCLTDEQRLEWPRTDLGIPDDIKEACIEYANYAAAGHLFIEYADAGSVRSGQSAGIGQRVTQTREKVGPIETEVMYESGGGVSQSERTDLAAVAGRYPRADTLMERYVRTTGRRRVIRG